MFARIRLLALLTLAVLAIAGCAGPSSGSAGAGLTIEKQTISIPELAGLLGLRVSEASPTHVTLKNSANTVMLFTYTGGKVYVNAQSVGQVGMVERTGGRTYVPRPLIEQIRSAMRTSVQPAVAPHTSSGCVVIDAGHGGRDPGATSCLGFYEKSVNLAVARKVSYLLKQRGLKVVMTRDADTFLELEERAAIGNRCRADLFVSIHSDSSPSSSTRGYTLYVARSASRSSRRAASAISKSMARTGLSSRGVQRADFRVLVQTRGPAVLVELGYLSNAGEARLLRDGAFQNRLARALASGISDFLARVVL